MQFTFALVFLPDSIPKSQLFWELICSAPEILRPKSAGETEPLKNIERLNPNDFNKEIIWRNGKKCLGYFQPNGFKGKATLSISLQYENEDHESLINSIRNWLQANFNYHLLYGVSPNEALEAHNLELQQIVSCGAIPPNESIITDNAHLFEVFECKTLQT